MHTNCLQTQQLTKVCKQDGGDCQQQLFRLRIYWFFSVEDVSLANEKYDRIVQIENEDISDLGISDFSNDEGENEESEVDDPDFDQ